MLHLDSLTIHIFFANVSAKHLFDGIAAQTNKLANILDDVIHSYVHIVSEFNTGTNNMTKAPSRTVLVFPVLFIKQNSLEHYI